MPNGNGKIMHERPQHQWLTCQSIKAHSVPMICFNVMIEDCDV